MRWRRVDAHSVFRFTREVFRATAAATERATLARTLHRPRPPPAWRAARQMLDPAPVPSPLDHGGGVTPRFVARLPRSGGFQSVVARLAIPLPAIATRSAPHREMRAGGGVRNICNQACFPRQNSRPRAPARHSVKYEMAAGPPPPLLSPAIARVRAGPPPRGPARHQTRGCARLHRHRARVPSPLARWRAHTIAPTKRADLVLATGIPTDRPAATDNAYRSSHTPPSDRGADAAPSSPFAILL